MRQCVKAGRVRAAALCLTLVASVALAPAGAMAADGDAVALAPEKAANLDVATRIAGALLPKGIYRKMMATTFDGMLTTMSAQLGEMPLNGFLNDAGIAKDEVGPVEPVKLGQIMAITDPAYDERMERSMKALGGFMAEMMDQYEPAVREGLAEAYAKRFSAAQLADIERFFATPTGGIYASEAMLIQADPAIMSRMMAMMPDMMKRGPEMVKAMEEATRGLPKPRAYKDLSAKERQQLADLLGIDRKKMKP